jgi:hypothetical protein
MATRRRASAAAAGRRKGVLDDPAAEADRRCDFYQAWFDTGMTKGTAREAYFEALDAGLLEGDDCDFMVAASKIAATKPAGNADPIATRKWRRVT